MKVHLANLSYGITEAALRDACEAYGSVTEIFIPTDRLTGRPRGFAFVTFASSDVARAAIAGLNGRELDGRPLRATEARPTGDPAPGAPAAGTAKKNFGPDRKAGAFAARYRHRR